MKSIPAPARKGMELLVGFVLFQYAGANLVANPVGTLATVAAVFALAACYVRDGIAAGIWRKAKKRFNLGISMLIEVGALYLLVVHLSGNAIANPVGSAGWVAATAIGCTVMIPDGICARLVRGGQRSWKARQASTASAVTAPAAVEAAEELAAPAAVEELAAPAAVTDTPSLGDPSMN